MLLKHRAKTMYKGVLRDDERRKEKMQQREAEFAESQRKRALYERVQQVSQTDSAQPGSWRSFRKWYDFGLPVLSDDIHCRHSLHKFEPKHTHYLIVDTAPYLSLSIAYCPVLHLVTNKLRDLWDHGRIPSLIKAIYYLAHFYLVLMVPCIPWYQVPI